MEKQEIVFYKLSLKEIVRKFDLVGEIAALELCEFSDYDGDLTIAMDVGGEK